MPIAGSARSRRRRRRGSGAHGGQESLDRVVQPHPVDELHLRTAGIPVGEEASGLPGLADMAGPTQGVDVFGHGAVLGLVPPRARHAAAAGRQDRRARGRSRRTRSASRVRRPAPSCVQCNGAAGGSRRPHRPLAAHRSAGRATPGRAARPASRPCPAPRRTRRGRSASSRDRARRASTPVAASSCNIAAFAAATRSNAPRNPCTCSALPFGRYGASQGRKPSACDRSSRSSRSWVS